MAVRQRGGPGRQADMGIEAEASPTPLPDTSVPDALRTLMAVSGGGCYADLMNVASELLGKDARRSGCVKALAEALDFSAMKGLERSVARHDILVAMLDRWPRWDAKSKDDIQGALDALGANVLHLVTAAAFRTTVLDPIPPAIQLAERMGLHCKIAMDKPWQGATAGGSVLRIDGQAGPEYAPVPVFDLGEGFHCPTGLILNNLCIQRLAGVWTAGALTVSGCRTGRLQGDLPHEAVDLHAGYDRRGRVQGISSISMLMNDFTTIRGIDANSLILRDERACEAGSLADLELAPSICDVKIIGLTNIDHVDGRGLPPEGVSLEYGALPKSEHLTVEHLRGESRLVVNNLGYGQSLTVDHCSLAKFAITLAAIHGADKGGDRIGVDIHDCAVDSLEVKHGSTYEIGTTGREALWDFSGGFTVERSAIHTFESSSVQWDARAPLAFPGTHLTRFRVVGGGARLNADCLDGVQWGPPSEDSPLRPLPGGGWALGASELNSMIPFQVLAHLSGQR